MCNIPPHEKISVEKKGKKEVGATKIAAAGLLIQIRNKGREKNDTTKKKTMKRDGRKRSTRSWNDSSG